MAQYLVTVRQRHDPGAPQQLYLLDGDLSAADVQRLADELLQDSVVQEATWCEVDDLAAHDTSLVVIGAYSDTPVQSFVEVAYKPGVTDNEAESIRIGAQRLGVDGLATVKTLRRYRVPSPEDAAGLYNELIQTALVYQPDTPAATLTSWYRQLLQVPAEVAPQVDRVRLCDAADDELMRISQAGVLSLDLHEMRAIRDYFRREERDPTDGELETLAQTWSEHCSHKTFKGRVKYQNREPRTENREPPGGYPTTRSFRLFRVRAA